MSSVGYGLEVDRVAATPSLAEVLRRRLDGRFPLDAFGADPQVQDLVAPLVAGVVRVDVRGGAHLPRVGAALLVANRGLGIAEPAALAVAVRRTVSRRLRVVGAPALPVVGGLTRKLGGIGFRADDVAVALRAGHLVAAPLAPTWWRLGAGEPPRDVLAAALGSRVLPAAVVPGGPLGLPIRAWNVQIGPPIEIPTAVTRGDPLAAAELAERARDAVATLLRASG